MLSTTSFPDASSADTLVSPLIDERRLSTRLAGPVSVLVTGLGSTAVHGCMVEDISESGAYLQVPEESGLAVGQRCEVSFSSDEEAAGPASLAGETCYATVVRSRRLSKGEHALVGLGLRFDQPLFL